MVYRQSALAGALENPIQLNTVKNAPTKKNNKILIQEIGFNGKLPVYQVCVKLLEAKKPKPIET